jgi:branched-chain amino acid transport system substrate-binding protein
MVNRRIFSFGTLAVAALAAATLTGCKPGNDPGTNGGPSDDTYGLKGEPIKIGLVASQNGDLIPWGTDCIQGAQLAIEEANKAGGYDGRPFKLIVEDSASTPEGGKSATEKLVQQDVVGVLGEVASGITQPMSQVTAANDLPHIAVGATKTTITDIGPNVFRVCYTDDFQGPVMAKFAYEGLGLKTVAIMTDEKQPYSQYLSKMFKEYYVKLGGKIVAEESYESKQTTFTAQLTRIQAKNPQGVFLSGYFNEVGPIVRQAATLGIKNVKYFGGDGWDSTEIIESGGDAIVGGYFCNHYNDKEDRPEVKKFLDAWKAKYDGKIPGTTMGALGYDAAALMVDAIKRAGSTEKQAMIDAIENTENFPGVSGSITLKGMGGNPKKPALIVEVTKDGFKAVKSYEYEEIYTEPQAPIVRTKKN